MHRSRLYGVFVDSPFEHADAAMTFWPSALGASDIRAATPGDPYTALHGVLPTGLTFEVQAVDDAARYHLDIETDDVEAEVARLTALGAVEHQRQPSWVIMKAPGGHLFCVVPVQSGQDAFHAAANVWD